MNETSTPPTKTHNKGQLFGYILLGALMVFEIFNYSTTNYALTDLLGDLRFMGIRWATILSLAFCGIDFAGIARIFTPEQSNDEPAEIWYLFGGWLLAVTMNAMLTWWGVAVAMLKKGTPSIWIPIFVAVMVWLIRILIISTFSFAGRRIFADQPSHPTPQHSPPPPTDYYCARCSASLPNSLICPQCGAVHEAD